MASFKFLKAFSGKIYIYIYIYISCIYNPKKFHKLQKYKYLNCNINVAISEEIISIMLP